MGKRWAQETADHDAFARLGQAEALRRTLRRHGALLLSTLVQASAAEPRTALVDVVAAFCARRYRGDADLWLPQLLRAAVEACPRLADAGRGRLALHLAGHGALDVEHIAVVLHQTPDETATAMVEAVAAACGAVEDAPGAFHLSADALSRLAAGILEPAMLARATAHVSVCDVCRGRAARVVAAVSGSLEAPPAEVPDFDAALLESAVEAARAERLRQALWPRALRFMGLRPGAARRPVRLAFVGTLAALLLLSALTTIRAAHWAGQTVESNLTVRGTPSLLSGATTAVAVEIRPVDPSKPLGVAQKGVSLHGVLRGSKGRTLAEATGTTDENGVAVLRLTVADLESTQDAAMLEVDGEVNGVARHVTARLDVQRKLRQHLSVDKPTYQPGQTIHLRGLSLDQGSGKPLAGRPAHLLVADPRGNRIVDIQTSVSPMGVSAADVELSPGAALGRYTATLVLEGGEVTTSLLVERYTLPPFTVSVTPDIRSTDGRAPFHVDVGAKFTTGVPMARGMVRLNASIDGYPVQELTGPIKDGLARFTVTLPPEYADQRRPWGQSVVLHAAVRDPAGRAEEASGGVALEGDTMSVALVSEAPSVRRNLPRANRILVRATRPDGSAVQTAVALFAPGDGELQTVGAGERLGEAQTNADGLATLDLPPAFFGRPLAVLAADPKDKKQYWTTMEAPPMRNGALVLGCDRSLLRAGETLSCEVFVPSPSARTVSAALDGQIVALAATPAVQGIQTVTLTIPAAAAGLLRIDMQDAPSEDEVHVLAAPFDGLRVTLTGTEPKSPGEEVALHLNVTDGQGKPRAASVGLAVVDAAVFARAAGTTPQQVIQALFAQPALAAAGMALLFPEPTESTVAPNMPAPNPWTSRQQVSARWLLASTQTSAPTLLARASLETDQQDLSMKMASSRSMAESTCTVTALAFVFATLVTLLIVFFWFRAVFVALCAAIAVGVGLKLLLGVFGGMRDSTVDPVALTMGLLAFAAVVMLARAQRAEIARGTTVSMRWLNYAAPVALLVLVGGAAMLSGRRYEMASPTSGGMRYDAMPQRNEAPAAPGGGQGYFKGDADEAEEKARPMAAAPAAASAAPMAEKEDFANKLNAAMAGEGSNFVMGAGKGGMGMRGLGAADKPRSSRTESHAGGARPADHEAAISTRDDFPETLYFNPSAVTGEDGNAEVKFRVADSITTWEAHALASDARGALGAGAAQIVVNKDFHVDLDVPTDLTVGDDVTLQIAAQNERATPGMATLTATADDGLKLDVTPLKDPVPVAAHGITGRLVPLQAVHAGRLFVKLVGELSGANGLNDALKRPITVTPNGRDVRQTFSGLVIDQVRRSVDVPADAYVEGKSVKLTLLGSPLAAALDGLHWLAEEPHGSFEQQVSTIYANALILKALQATGRTDKAQEEQLERYLRLSYQDLLGFESTVGGSGGFGGYDGLALAPHTAYGLMVLTEMARTTYVDENVLDRGRATLLGKQAGDHGFGTPAETAYVAMALMSQDPDCLSKEDPKKPWTAAQRGLRSACAKLFERLGEAFALVEGVDSYTLALAADALVLAGPDQRAKADLLLDELDRRGAIVGDGRMRRVTFPSRSSTIYGARGLSAEIETTALMAHALISHGGRPDKAREALRSLLVLRDARGGFYSSQGTALALRALLAAAQAGQAGGRATISLGGTEVQRVEFDPANLNTPQVIDLTAALDRFASGLAPYGPGSAPPGAELTIATDGWDGATDLAYVLTTHYFQPWTSPAGKAASVGRQPGGVPINTDGADPQAIWLSMDQRMDAASYGLGDQAMLSVDIGRSGGQAPQGLLIAQIGLPPGFHLAPNTFEDGVIGNVRRIEPAARGITVYLDDLGYGVLPLRIPLVAARAVRSVVVPRGRVYFPYQPSVEAQAAPVPVYVRALLGKRTAG